MKVTVTKVEKHTAKFGSYTEVTLSYNGQQKKVTSIRGYDINTLLVGDTVDTYMVHPVTRLKKRLARIGIDINLVGNLPWIYMNKVNGTTVTELFKANHGFCVGYSESSKLTDIPEIFKMLRKYKD